MKLKTVLGILILVASFLLSCWLSIGVMLVGGINMAIDGFTAQNISQGVWGIVRALFSEIGFLPFYVCWFVGLEAIVDGCM